MNEQSIIDRLKTDCPFFNGNIAGIASYTDEVDASRLPVPAAYVARDGGEAAASGSLGRATQMWVESYSILVVVSNAADTLGEQAAADIRPAIQALFASLIGWPSPQDNSGEHDNTPLDYVRDENIGQDRGRITHQVVFSTSSAIGPDA